ncbi:MAG: IRE (iron responsive element), partial [Thermoguttaceae bacterium]|nr:IRE (iron responsive element) [Thermoguttaceae bacterium]
MTQKKLFYRKIFYIVLIAILIFPLYMMGNPSQIRKDGFSSGGLLARQRSQYGLAEANLGEVDPASSTMKLATFGMRGVAITMLWHRSLEYEKRADWNNVVVTGNLITALEPHFLSIWDFVGWKLAYNASSQFDDYRERYRYVIEGFEFIQRGTNYNETAPKLFSKAGWTISQKIGVADEKMQYRRLFREDNEFHARQESQKISTHDRDNWRFGRLFYKKAEDLY